MWQPTFEVSVNGCPYGQEGNQTRWENSLAYVAEDIRDVRFNDRVHKARLVAHVLTCTRVQLILIKTQLQANDAVDWAHKNRMPQQAFMPLHRWVAAHSVKNVYMKSDPIQMLFHRRLRAVLGSEGEEQHLTWTDNRFLLFAVPIAVLDESFALQSPYDQETTFARFLRLVHGRGVVPTLRRIPTLDDFRVRDFELLGVYYPSCRLRLLQHKTEPTNNFILEGLEHVPPLVGERLHAVILPAAFVQFTEILQRSPVSSANQRLFCATSLLRARMVMDFYFRGLTCLQGNDCVAQGQLVLCRNCGPSDCSQGFSSACVYGLLHSRVFPFSLVLR